MEIWGDYFPYEVKNTYMNVCLPSACEEMCALCSLVSIDIWGTHAPCSVFSYTETVYVPVCSTI